jgi:hypothetical protein
VSRCSLHPKLRSAASLATSVPEMPMAILMSASFMRARRVVGSISCDGYDLSVLFERTRALDCAEPRTKRYKSTVSPFGWKMTKFGKTFRLHRHLRRITRNGQCSGSSFQA